MKGDLSNLRLKFSAISVLHSIYTPMPALHHLPAPAKLNLFLHIVGRRADGYHLLQSVFMLIDCCDHLHIETRTSNGISREDLHGANANSLPTDDLCVRAAKALQAATGCTLGAHIALEKNTPSEAGMGGGSSDAATVLFALNQLWDLQLNREQLMQIGMQLGADVPFFLLGENAWVEGVGEQLRPITLAPAQFLIVKPPHGVATAEIFQHPELQRASKLAIIEDFAQRPYQYGNNAMQNLALRLNPEIAQALNLMAKHNLQARMTGSGSAVFAKIGKAADAAALLAELPQGWFAKMVHNLPRHPFIKW